MGQTRAPAKAFTKPKPRAIRTSERTTGVRQNGLLIGCLTGPRIIAGHASPYISAA
jgi:hypothetical protein